MTYTLLQLREIFGDFIDDLGPDRGTLPFRLVASALLAHLQQREVKGLRPEDAGRDASVVIREGLRYAHFGKVAAERARLRDGR